jgi:hypothetical protein
MNNTLVFYSNTNSHGKQDASGAFVPEALAFQRYHKIPDENCIGINCTKNNPPESRRDQVLRIIGNRKNLDLLAFFGHGWPNGIQFGLQRRHIPFLVQHLDNPSDSLKVVIYACLTAENDVRDTDIHSVGPATDGGFADLLRDELVRHGITKGWVDGHKTAGHATWNPYVVRFLCESVDNPEIGGEGGAYIVPPNSQFWRKWVNVLRKNPDVRYWFPLQTEMEIKEGLLHL